MHSSQSKGKRKAFYRRCAAGEQRAKQRRLESQEESLPVDRVPRKLEPGVSGILITCNNHEDRLALSESYRLLNDSHGRLTRNLDGDVTLEENQVSSTPIESKVSRDGNDPDDDDNDVTATLRKELLDQASTKASKFLFNATKTGVSNCLFVVNQSIRVSSAQLVHDVFHHVLESKQASSRRILRFQPVAGTCRPSLDDLKKLLSSVWFNFLELNRDSTETLQCAASSKAPPQRAAFLKPKVTAEPEPTKRTFTVNFKARNYDRLTKSNVVTTVILTIGELSPDWLPICAAADVVISVDILCNVLCLSVLEKFTEFFKYNLRELSPAS